MELHERFEQAIQNRDRLRAQIQRAQGKLDSALSQLAEVEGICKSKNIDPTKLDVAIHQLQRRYEAGVEAFELQVEEAMERVAPYLED